MPTFRALYKAQGLLGDQAIIVNYYKASSSSIKFDVFQSTIVLSQGHYDVIGLPFLLQIIPETGAHLWNSVM